MRTHVQAQAPLEACGLAAGREERVEGVVVVRNAAHSAVRFRMDPQEQLKAFTWMEAQGLELVAIFHSHPSGPPTLSATDLAEAAYPCAQILWCPESGGWAARAFWIVDGRADEGKLQVIEEQ